MNSTDKNFEKRKRLLQLMTPQELCNYCTQRPSDSLAIGIKDARTKNALSVMAYYGKKLSHQNRLKLVAYIQRTSKPHTMITSDKELHSFYSTIFQDSQIPHSVLSHAIKEFIGFTAIPVDTKKHGWLNQFMKDILPENASLNSSSKTTTTPYKRFLLLFRGSPKGKIC